ncbi:MAG: hypothetical protein AAF627_15045 [Myxococcota bacterium]
MMNAAPDVDWSSIAAAVRELSVPSWSAPEVEDEPRLAEVPPPPAPPPFPGPEPSAEITAFPVDSSDPDPLSAWGNEEELVELLSTPAPEPAPAPPRPTSAPVLGAAPRPKAPPVIPNLFSGSDAPVPPSSETNNRLSDLQGFDWD